MKVLFAYRGYKQHQFDKLGSYDTSHMSSVNDVILCHTWRSMEHDIDVWAGGIPDPAKYDLLYLFKLHCMAFVSRGYLDLPWKRIACWFDFGKLDKAFPDSARDKLNSIAWGTRRLMQQESANFPMSKGLVVEHATVFPSRPALPKTQPNGVYLGRIPAVYRTQLEYAAAVAPFKIFALKLELPTSKLLLRPGQYTEHDLAAALAWCPKGSTLSPGINLIGNPAVASGCFGLVPSTKFANENQALSACKAWDYWALGLPIVIADNTPEMHWVSANPFLGFAYRVGYSVDSAVRAAIEQSKTPGFPALRERIQNWVFASHTWQHRAKEIADAQFSS